MKKNGRFLIFLVVLIALLVAGCTLDEGTVIITNNSKKDFYGRAWTDTEELYKGSIHAWNSKFFNVPFGVLVYTDFESSDGDKSNPSGRVTKNRTLILDL